jgi:hypothetical protein
MFFMSSSDSAEANALHDGALALAGLELLQLLDQVLGVLLRQLGVGGCAGIAVGAVAAGAHGGEAGLAFDQVGLGNLGRGRCSGRGGLVRGCGFAGGKRRHGRHGQQSGQEGSNEQLHIGGFNWLAHKTYNFLILQWLLGIPDYSGLAAASRHRLPAGQGPQQPRPQGHRPLSTHAAGMQPTFRDRPT